MKRPKPPEPRFIIDENMGSSIAEAIADAGGQPILLTDLVPRGTEDVAFIPRLREWGEAFITRDLAMRANQNERTAIEACGIHVFLIRAGGLRVDELRTLIGDRYSSMRNYVHKYGLPFLARVTKAGIEVLSKTGRRGGIKK